PLSMARKMSPTERQMSSPASSRAAPRRQEHTFLATCFVPPLPIGSILANMAKTAKTDAEIVEKARLSRERARATAKTSTRLLHEAAQLEETVRQTEERLKALKDV